MPRMVRTTRPRTDQTIGPRPSPSAPAFLPRAGPHLLHQAVLELQRKAGNTAVAELLVARRGRGAALTAQRLSSSVLAGRDLRVLSPGARDRDARHFQRKIDELTRYQASYDNWELNSLTKWQYTDDDHRKAALQRAVNWLDELLDDSDRLVGDLKRAPETDEYDRLFEAAKHLRWAQLADQNEHKATLAQMSAGPASMGAGSDVWADMKDFSETMLGRMIDMAPTAYDHVGDPDNPGKTAEALTRGKMGKKDKHSVYLSRKEAVLALQDFLFFHAGRLHRPGSIRAEAPTRLLPIWALVAGLDRRSARVSATQASRVHVDVEVHGVGDFSIDHGPYPV